VGEQEIEVVRKLYGFDWVGLGSREQGFAELEHLMAPEFRARVSPELGERELEGIEGMTVFIEALEQDFAEFRYVADEFGEVGDGGVFVHGRIIARGRSSGMPLTSGFSHVWTLRDGLVLRVEAHLDRAAAEQAPEV
jgi:ketosteroid isomerase-like protein